MGGAISWLHFVEKNRRYATLLTTLVALILVVPVLDQTVYGDLVFRAMIALIVVAAIWAVSDRSRVFWAVVVVGIPSALVGFAADLDPRLAVESFHLAVTLLFLAIIMVLVFRSLLHQPRVDSDTVLGGISVYLLMVVFFTVLFGLVEHLAPGSFEVRGVAMTGSPESLAADEFWSVMIYFSMVTITTLGYGDVAPTQGAALILSSGEAVLGQLYVAVFIARLVALYTRSGGGTD